MPTTVCRVIKYRVLTIEPRDGSFNVVALVALEITLGILWVFVSHSSEPVPTGGVCVRFIDR